MKAIPLCALILGSTAAFASPPVKVEVSIDEEEDFFDEAKKPATAVEQVKENAEAAFDALEREEARHGKPANKSNQVVNVIVMGEDEQTKVETPAIPVTPEITVAPVEPERRLTRQERWELKRQARADRQAEKMRRRQEKLELKRQKLEMKREHQEWVKENGSWWGDPSYSERGDFLLQFQGGLNGQGAFGGFGAEYFLTDYMGLRSGVQFSRIGRDEDPNRTIPNFDFTNGGVWANRADLDLGNLESGSAHLIDASLAFHVIPRSRFDLYPNIGFGYMGYNFDYGAEQDKGGAGYLRVGAGFNIVIKRFFIGMDFGWYPYELFHHGGSEVARTQAALSEARFATTDGGEPETVEEDDGEGRFDPLRMTMTAHFGIRF
jgi:hypothetical protein